MSTQFRNRIPDVGFGDGSRDGVGVGSDDGTEVGPVGSSVGVGVGFSVGEGDGCVGSKERINIREGIVLLFFVFLLNYSRHLSNGGLELDFR